MLAAIDLGSNSFRLYIGKYENGVIHVFKSVREPNRLAAGLDDNGRLSEKSMQSGLKALHKLRGVLDQYPITRIRAVATSTLRVAINAQDFLHEAEKVLGYPIEVISGEEEGRLIYLGVIYALASADEERLVIDVGGGSTELILGQGQKIKNIESLDVGTVKQSKCFFPAGRIELSLFHDAITSVKKIFDAKYAFYALKGLDIVYGASSVICAIAKIISKNKIGDGSISIKNLKVLQKKMIQCGQAEKLEMEALKPARAFLVVAGVSILLGLMDKLKINVIKPIHAGLRMGIMWDLYLSPEFS